MKALITPLTASDILPVIKFESVCGGDLNEL
jgi:hypothetical protein